MKNWKILGSVTAAAVLLAAFPAYGQEKTLPEGIYVGEVSLGGLTQEEAAQEIQELVDRMSDRKVVLEVEDLSAETTAQDLGFTWSNPDAVEEAAGYVAEGNLIQRYMALKDLEKNPVVIPLKTQTDETLVENFIAEECKNLPGEPKNAQIRRENGAFVITEGTEGIVVDTEATRQMLDEALAVLDGADVKVQAAVTIAQPQIKAADLESIGDVLGTFSTSFSSSGAARSKNLEVGSAKINGHVLMPGETLSGYECMQPFTIANGYYTAAAYENGQVVDSVGGGVCQIATTLYNAALRAELEITQRQNHSMVVGYVKPSMDAAIAGTYKDIKVTNNYSTPIYVEGGTSGKTLTFTIYGKETRPKNREVIYESKTISVQDPGEPKEQYDATLAPGTRKKVQSAHTGMKSELWKVVKVDGTETERTLLNKDTYMASKGVVLVGPALPAETVPAETEPPQAGESASGMPSTETPTASAAPTEGNSAGPGVTEPSQTQTPTVTPSPGPSAGPAAGSTSPVSEIPAPPAA